MSKVKPGSCLTSFDLILIYMSFYVFNTDDLNDNSVIDPTIAGVDLNVVVGSNCRDLNLKVGC